MECGLKPIACNTSTPTNAGKTPAANGKEVNAFLKAPVAVATNSIVQQLTHALQTVMPTLAAHGIATEALVTNWKWITVVYVQCLERN